MSKRVGARLICFSLSLSDWLMKHFQREKCLAAWFFQALPGGSKPWREWFIRKKNEAFHQHCVYYAAPSWLLEPKCWEGPDTLRWTCRVICSLSSQRGIVLFSSSPCRKAWTKSVMGKTELQLKKQNKKRYFNEVWFNRNKFIFISTL